MTFHTVLCVGETIEIRKAGKHFSFLESQLDSAFADIDINKAADISIAYEPVWAIGTGVNATIAEVGPMVDMIRRWADGAGFPGGGNSLRILYGGSVNEENSAELYAVDGVDGFLVGGASLEAFTFAAILDSMNKRL
jgi:triosephosphate isomerase